MAVNVGTAEIAVVPEMKNFGQQAASGLSSAKSGLTKAAGLLGVGLGAAFALSFGKEIVGAANEAERSNKRLAAATEGTSVSTQKLIDDFAALGLETAQDDEMLKDLAATLLRMGFKGSTSQLEAEVQAITDLGAATSKGTNIITRFFVALNTGNVTKAISSARTLGLVTQEQADHFKEMAAQGKAAEVIQRLLTRAEERGNGAAAAQATALDKLANRWAEFKEELGTGVKVALENVGFIFEGLKQNIPGVVAVLGLLTLGWVASGGAASAAETAYLAASYALDAALGPIGLVVGALSLLTLGWAENAKIAAQNAETIDAWAQSISDGDATLEQFQANLAASDIPGWAQDTADAAVEQVKLKTALLDLDKGLKDGTLSAAEYTAKARELGLTSRQITANLNAEKEQSDDTGDSVIDLAKAHRIAAEAAHAQKIAEEQLAGGLLGLRADAQAIADSQATLNQLRADGKTKTREYRDAEADLLQNQLTLTSDIREYNAALKEQGLTSDDVRDKVLALGRSLGLTKQDVENILGPLGQYDSLLRNLPDEVVTNVRTTYSHQQLAAGGVALGGTTLVGERGPELVELPRGAVVTPNSEIRRGRVRAAGWSDEPVHIVGELKIADWRNGIGKLDAELAWGDAPARTG